MCFAGAAMGLKSAGIGIPTAGLQGIASGRAGLAFNASKDAASGNMDSLFTLHKADKALETQMATNGFALQIDDEAASKKGLNITV